MKNPWIYPVIFFILAIVALILLTILLYYYNQNHQCRLNPNIWCWDDFSCPGVTGATLTPSQIYGPTSSLSTLCYGNTSTLPDCVCGWTGTNPGTGGINQGCTGTYDPSQAY